MISKLVENNHLILDEIKKGAQKDGSGDADVFSSASTETRVVFEHKDFSLSTSHSTQMYGVRSIVQDRLGFVTTNSESEAALREAARESQMVARLSAPNPHHKLADRISETKYHQAIDPNLLEVSPAQLGEFAEQMVAPLLSDSRILIDRAEITCSVDHWTFSSSKGFDQTASATHINWYIMGMAKSGEELTSIDYDGSMVRQLVDLKNKMGRMVLDVKESLLGSLGAQKGKTYKGPVMLHPEAVMDLMGGLIASNCNGLRQQDGMSSWKEKRGAQVASEKLLVFEDPLNLEQPQGWSPFDREGVTTGKHTLIQNGHLSFVAHNCFSASREGVKPTGNATGGSRSLPGIGFHNLSVAASDVAQAKTDQELLKSFNQGLVIKRFSGNSDFTSGQFSGVAKNSWWVENGQRAFPVTEVMIAGNLFDLVKQVLEIGKEAHLLGGGGMAPYIIVDGVSVTA